jgi:Zn-dependent protease with chaperone function
MILRHVLSPAALVLAAACTVTTAPPPSAQRAPEPVQTRDVAVAQLSRVVDRVEPVAEQECRRLTRGVECDLQIFVDEDPRKPPNAFQTLDRNGDPVIVFTMALAQDARNDDELAFILGHEAAHHILGHIPQTQQSAVLGAVLAGALAQAGGISGSGVQIAQDLGASVGSRAFSKDYELEADRLGTIIAARAGYDPVRGAEYFARIPDPGDRFLGSHPPNADRIRVVRQTAAGL